MNKELEHIIYQDLIEKMKENILKLGKARAWKIINENLRENIRLSYIELYLQAI